MRRQARSVRSGIPRFLTTGQSAAVLGVSVNALKAWIREERVPALRTPGGHHRIREADLLAFRARLAVRSRPTTQAALRILLVDDDAEVLGVLRDAVREAVPSAVVELATDGYEALVQVGASRPDVLVLDLRMPLLDGFEVCRRLKAWAGTRSVRILAITAYPEGGARERILECGADDFLEKPFEMAQFRSRLLALLPTTARR